MKLHPTNAAVAVRGAVRSAVTGVQRPVREQWRRTVLRRGVDDTLASTRRSTLVIAPHPDDETIGCGATIARKRAAGTEVDVVVVCDGRRSHRSAVVTPGELASMRQQESISACTRLGVAEGRVRNLGFEEMTLWRCLDAVVEALAAVIEETAPEEILVVSGHDWHPDHRAVHEALVRAAARRAYCGVVGAYPVWYWADGPWRTDPLRSVGAAGRRLVTDPVAARRDPPARLVRTDGFVTRKREAFACYVSQTTCLTGEPEWATFPPGWIDPFCGPFEVFFPVSVTVGSTEAAVHGGPRDVTSSGRAPDGTGPFLGAAVDLFDDDRLAGAVVGTVTRSGALRHGVDVEATISIDNGAARFATLDQPGWARQGLAYGPFRRVPGLTLAASVLNSHNTAQSNILDEGRRALLRRFVHNFPHGTLQPEFLTDNLAVGFFPEPVPADGRVGGNAFLMHAGSALNGELRARVGGTGLRAHLGIQELPILYLVVLREEGATYYASSVPGAAGLGHHPMMRPIAVDHTGADPVVFAGVHQAVHGEVSHQISSRIHRVEITPIAAFEQWCATALLGDRFLGSGPLDGAPLEVGTAVWTVTCGALTQDHGALRAGADGPAAEAATRAPEPVGLLCVGFQTAPIFAETGRAGLGWRQGAHGDGWRVLLGPDEAILTVQIDGVTDVVATARCEVQAARRYQLQVLDDGETFGVHLDGQLLFDRWFDDRRLADECGVSVLTGPGDRSVVRIFEVHGRAVPIPPELDPGPPWSESGDRVVVHERFDGDANAPLDQASGTTVAGATWERSLGAGRFVRTGHGSLLVDASVARPNPGRTLYTVAWPDPAFADIEVTMLPPGRQRGEGHAGRGGLTFWQDESNYVVLNMWLDDWDGHDGSSISMFLRAGGHEHLYDAVWTNVGRRVTWGTPFTLRASCDGERLLARLDGEPVFFRSFRDVYRRMTPLQINRVGLAANWEWGDDTGTEFTDFIARAR